eukprot:TRINITY_DN58554_c0_g2_i1.p1 TRINITY_DN58554_c0_g2~~TRINITY_DN58554_c0_g2_i1.p1  ORF type:complete len:338 (-),score=33.88 TRINITY_DN58554_c0_g2_i1:32-1045(-)
MLHGSNTLTGDAARTLFTTEIGYSVFSIIDFADCCGWFAWLIIGLEGSFVGVDKCLKMLKVEPQADTLASHKTTTTSKKTQPVSRTARVEFRDVVMRYKEDIPPALRGIWFTIEPGQRVGIVGRTGSGKSSMIKALMRIVEVESGQILMNGLDISQIGLQSLRSQMSVIQQEACLFEGSVLFNLDPTGNTTEEEAWKVLRLVGLDETVKKFGLHSNVHSQGSNFSVGQRQLLCIGRVLLARNNSSLQVVILDEATGNVDSHTDGVIQNVLANHLSGTNCSVLCIAHRLHTVADYDKVLVVNNGVIIEEGNPKQLASNPHSEWSSLLKYQTASKSSAA